MSVDQDPTVRFSNRASYYANCRPGYPDSVVEAVRADPGLPRDAVIVDIGSGTGLSAELFLRNGYHVFAVEPNPLMRHAEEERLRRYPGFHSVNGRAEATTLPPSCADLIVCASAFHWFDPDRARAEFRRLLRPQFAVAIMRNGRDAEGSAFMRSYTDIFRRYSARVRAHHNREERIRNFFGGHGYRTFVLNYREQIDFERLRGRILSYSSIPLPGESGYGAMMEELRAAFDREAEDGEVWYLGEITLHIGYLEDDVSNTAITG
ncbi:MAG TPA: methyltransferase domain-containing protein [Bryobacteraceae bacterium]|nr:methyltransferase domain-containing protein [Bryobacteraceae bacterium]